MLWCVCISIDTHTLPHPYTSPFPPLSIFSLTQSAARRTRRWPRTGRESPASCCRCQGCLGDRLHMRLLCGRGHWCWRLWWRSRKGKHRSQRTCGSHCPRTPGRALCSLALFSVPEDEAGFSTWGPLGWSSLCRRGGWLSLCRCLLYTQDTAVGWAVSPTIDEGRASRTSARTNWWQRPLLCPNKCCIRMWPDLACVLSLRRFLPGHRARCCSHHPGTLLCLRACHDSRTRDPRPP